MTSYPISHLYHDLISDHVVHAAERFNAGNPLTSSELDDLAATITFLRRLAAGADCDTCDGRGWITEEFASFADGNYSDTERIEYPCPACNPAATDEDYPL